MRIFNVAVVFMLATSGLHGETRKADLEEDEWSIGLYPFSFSGPNGPIGKPDYLVMAPKMPPSGSGPLVLQKFIEQSHENFSDYIKDRVQLPDGALVIYDPLTECIAARVTAREHRQFRKLSQMRIRRASSELIIDAWIVEADAKRMRVELRKALSASEHTDFFKTISKWEEHGNARILQTTRMSAQTGQSVSAESIIDLHEHEIELRVDQGGVEKVVQDQRPVGTIWEVDAVLESNGWVSMQVGLEYHFFEPSVTTFTLDEKEADELEFDLTSYHFSRLSRGILSKNGRVTLVGVWAPSKQAALESGDVLQAAFIRGTGVPAHKNPDRRLLKILEAEGANVTQVPEDRPKYGLGNEELPEGMDLRRYQIPITIHAEEDGSRDIDPDTGKPNLGNSPPDFSKPAENVFKNKGVKFPEGAYARYFPRFSYLVVCNTLDQLELVEFILDADEHGHVPKSVQMMIHVIEAKRETMTRFMEETRGTLDHGRAWANLIGEVGNPEIKILQTIWVGSINGHRAKLETGQEMAFFSKVDIEDAGDGKTFRLLTDRALVGTTIEVDGVVDADRETINLNSAIEHHFGLPKKGMRVPVHKTADGTMKIDLATAGLQKVKSSQSNNIRSRAARLLSTWQPSDPGRELTEDVLQAAILEIAVAEQVPSGVESKE